MTDFMFMPIWLLLSWLIRQVEGGIEDPEETGAEEQALQEVEYEPFEPVEQAIKIAIAGVSILLLGLSISAYRKTGFKKIVYAAIAFGLFAVQMLYEYLEDSVEIFSADYADVIFTGITLAIVVLFFMAIVRKK